MIVSLDNTKEARLPSVVSYVFTNIIIIIIIIGETALVFSRNLP
jgi:hypothetical protein